MSLTSVTQVSLIKPLSLGDTIQSKVVLERSVGKVRVHQAMI